jgi:hypothetical protein
LLPKKLLEETRTTAFKNQTKDRGGQRKIRETFRKEKRCEKGKKHEQDWARMFTIIDCVDAVNEVLVNGQVHDGDLGAVCRQP